MTRRRHGRLARHAGHRRIRRRCPRCPRPRHRATWCCWCSIAANRSRMKIAGFSTRRRARTDVVVLNKSDLPIRNAGADRSRSPRRPVAVSALSGDGFDALRRTIASGARGRGAACATRRRISNARHIALPRPACRASLEAARRAADAGNVPEEFLLIDLQAREACVSTRSSAAARERGRAAPHLRAILHRQVTDLASIN